MFWAMSEEDRLSEQTLAIINDPDNDIYFSTASVWEVVIKHAKNEALMPVSGKDFAEGCIHSGFEPLPIENHHVLTVGSLNRRQNEPPHQDPFDRVLIAQAKTEGMILLTRDRLLKGYAEKCVMVI